MNPEKLLHVVEAIGYIILGMLLLYGICLFFFPEAFSDEIDEDFFDVDK